MHNKPSSRSSNPYRQTLSPHALRAETAQRFAQIFNPKQQKSLDFVLRHPLRDANQHAWMSAALYGMCRFYSRYKYELATRLHKPFTENDADVEALLVLGLHQLSGMRLKPHAAINETVKACQNLNKEWAKNVVNAILRAYQRDLEAGSEYANEMCEYAHPNWLMKQIKQSWPEHWADILQANNIQAPLTLRVNLAQWSRAEALTALEKAEIKADASHTVPSAINLAVPSEVMALPNFQAGFLSVQDASAQLAAELLLRESKQITGLKILDACAAPGGKTGHMLESIGVGVEIHAVEKFANRAELIEENIARINLERKVNVMVTDILDYANETSHKYQRILADVPCTASGVIRRHPDIKLRRTTQDIKHVAQEQAAILKALWELLAVGGRLLYATCSVFKQENHDQIESFLASHQDAKVIPLKLEQAINSELGSQILPGSDQRDGFFYALLEKN